jgi:hypothetical protein
MSETDAVLFRHGSCELRGEDVVYIRRFLADFPTLSHTETILTLAEHLGWTTAAGGTKAVAAQRLLEQLERSGQIRLPTLDVRYRPCGGKRAPQRAEVLPAVAAAAPLRSRLAELAPVRLRLLAERDEERRFDAYLRAFHPLGYAKPFGFFARYFIEARGQPLGCILLSGAARALAARDRHIGWSARARRHNLPWVVGNSRFLIFPWVEVPHLASHALAQLARRLPDDWARRWSFRPLLLETFVDPAHYRGSCYLGAGWQALGSTSGRGLARPGQCYRSSPKRVLIKPLARHWRERLCCEDLCCEQERRPDEHPDPRRAP